MQIRPHTETNASAVDAQRNRTIKVSGSDLEMHAQANEIRLKVQEIRQLATKPHTEHMSHDKSARASVATRSV